MRTPFLFALALAGTVAASTDASAFGRRRAAAASSEGCYGGGAVTSSYGCYGSGYAMGYGYGSGYAASSGGCYGSGYAAYNRGGCYGSGYSTYAHGGCWGSAYAHSGYRSGTVAYSYPTYSTSSWGSATVYGGRAATIQMTDGTYYTLGADGTYYPAGWRASTVNGVVYQPSTGATVVTTTGYSPLVSNGTGVIQASGTTPLTTAATSVFRAKQVLGTQILVQGNAQVGTVEDMVTDSAGNLDYLIVSTGDNKLVTVPWEAAKFDPEKKTAVVNVTQEVWRAVPTYTTTTYPQFYTPTYRTDIYKVYGLTPRELRVR